MSIAEFWDSTLADMVRYIHARARRAQAESREQWSIMRYQTALILRMAQDSKSAPIQPVDVLTFEDEQSEREVQLPDPEKMAERDRLLNERFERYKKMNVI
jgi:hypothetical protein